jgi:hypothetical protein
MTKAIRVSTTVLGFLIAITFSFAKLAAAPLEKVNASYGAISGSMLANLQEPLNNQGTPENFLLNSGFGASWSMINAPHLQNLGTNS